MALFNVNGQETNDLREAINYCKAIWHESKKEAVQAQKVEALSKPTTLDRERAAVGITGNPSLGNKS